ncbi:MAG TPA: LptF/LptG family permease [Pirellulaceae bacterium]|mgnify:CR=1 FL=1|nr:LptF/LptG family permease [Pirellulaceae bacterium]HMO92746.1 LptF/LptG family permease [Pirellulaceae bacterium]HMP70298.1 LptF/LptG family permease [Pirellulaceae bacterium]
MTIFDRYLLRGFIKIFLICFVSLSGLFVIIHAFTNLDDVLALSKQRSLSGLLFDFYAPRVLDFFVQMTAVITLISAIFAFVMMQKSNEITAVEAAGMSKYRIARPLILMSVLLVIATSVARELVLPRFRTLLTLNAEDLLSEKLQPVRNFTDAETGITIRHGQIRASDGVLIAPQFILRPSRDAESVSIVAEHATYTTSPEGELGYWVEHVSVPLKLNLRPSLTRNDQTIVHYPSGKQWLAENQCFIVMNVPPQRIALSPENARYASLFELIEINKTPGANYSNRQRVEIHRRIVLPLLELTLIALGFPIVVCRRERNVFAAAALCMLAVGIISLTAMMFASMGASRILSPPALAAWLPLLIFSPIAATRFVRLNQ